MLNDREANTFNSALNNFPSREKIHKFCQHRQRFKHAKFLITTILLTANKKKIFELILQQMF